MSHVMTKIESGWSDGLPWIEETPAALSAFLDHAGTEASAELAPGMPVREVARQAVRAGCKAEYMPIVLAALRAVMDPNFHPSHLAGPFSTWPVFVVNGPIAAKIGLYNGPYVLASGAHANISIGRAISLALANCVPEIGTAAKAVLGSANRMAGLVIAEKEDTPWEPLHVTLGHPRTASTVTAFSTFQSPAQILPIGARYTSAARIAALYAANASEGWCGPGTRMVLVSPNAQRSFIADGWSKDDLRRYLVENTKISVAQLKRLRRWKGGSKDEFAATPVEDGDETHYWRLAADDLWANLHPAPGQGAIVRGFDCMPVVSGSEVAHLYTHMFYPYPTANPNPVIKLVQPA